jgi:hypothetical protein
MYEAFVVPDSFRLLPQFFSAMITTRREYRIRMFGRFREEPRGRRCWAVHRSVRQLNARSGSSLTLATVSSRSPRSSGADIRNGGESEKGDGGSVAEGCLM